MSKAVGGLTLGFAAGVASLLGLVMGERGAIGGRAALASGSFADIVERVNPSVVQISVVDTPGYVPADEEDEDEPPEPGPRRGEGSGFVIDAAGYILTNHHLVASPARIRVRLADKRELPAKLVGGDASTDLALLKVDSPGLPALALGDSDRLRVGEWVCAIGNPLSFEHSVTVGVISSKGRKIWDASFDSYLQTDAAINPGNSGGPLLNASGDVVGINAAMSVEGQGIGFAIPVNIAREVLGQLRSQGHVTRGYLGVELQELDPDLQKMVGLKDAHGAMVLDVVKGGSGDAAGLKRWDVITGLSGKPVEDSDHLVRMVSAQSPGSDVLLSVFRDGKPVQISAHLSERSEEAPAAPSGGASADRRGDALGLVVSDLSKKARRRLKIAPDRVGVVIHEVVGLSTGVDPLAHGDLILEVNRHATPDVASYRKAVAQLKPGELAFLYVYRPRPAGGFLAKVEVDPEPGPARRDR